MEYPLIVWILIAAWFGVVVWIIWQWQSSQKGPAWSYSLSTPISEVRKGLSLSTKVKLHKMGIKQLRGLLRIPSEEVLQDEHNLTAEECQEIHEFLLDPIFHP